MERAGRKLAWNLLEHLSRLLENGSTILEEVNTLFEDL